MSDIENSFILAIQQMLQPIAEDLNELKRSLPANYVSLRIHDLAIQTIHDRLSQLETWRAQFTQTVKEEQDEMRKSQNSDMKDVNESLVELRTDVGKLNEHLSLLIKILVWLLGIITSIVVAAIIAYITHHIQ